MSLNLLKPQHGLPKKPSEIRDNLQHILGAALPDCILPEDDNTFGFKITSQTGLTVRVGAGRGIIGKKYHDDRNYHDITLPARRACLLYKLKNTATDSVTPSDGYVEAILPQADANTIVRYDFSTWDGVSAIPNSAVGVNGNTIAVANALTKTGTVTRVDGHVGYAMQGDGATGYGVSQNSTGFPVGATEREMSLLLTVNSISNTQTFIAYGTNAASQVVQIWANGSKIYVGGNNSTSDLDTGFDIEVGKTYEITMTYDGSIMKVYINGVLIASRSEAFATSTGVMYVGRYISAGKYFASTIHYIELRNKMRTPAQIAQINNNLLLPCSYQTPQSPVPLMTANSSQGCVASASSEYSTSTKAYLAFRKGSVAGDVGWESSAGTTGWLQLTLPTSFAPKYVDIQNIASIAYYPKDFTIYGSNDGGSTRVTLLTVTGAVFSANERKRFYILGASAYTTLGINVTANGGGAYVMINDLDFGTDIVSTTDIRSILPANAISLGLVKTGSIGVNEIETKKRKYGRIEGVTGGNRIANREWKYITVGIAKDFDNPFGTENVKVSEIWYKKNLTDSKHSVIDSTINTNRYGVFVRDISQGSIIIQTGNGGIVESANSYTGVSETTGYIAIIAEVLE